MAPFTVVRSLLNAAARRKQQKAMDAGGSEGGRTAIVARTNQQSSQLYYLFKGVEHRFMMNPLTFLSKTGILERNLVMLRDAACSLYHGTIADDLCGFESILARLQEYGQNLSGCSEVYCSGTSAGAYAAILFGHYLQVDVVIAFAPPTLIDVEEFRKRHSLSPSWILPEKHRDLAALLAEGNGRTEYRLYYCRNCARDRIHAERLARCPGVSLHPQPGNKHNVVDILDNLGGLEEIFSSGRLLEN